MASLGAGAAGDAVKIQKLFGFFDVDGGELGVCEKNWGWRPSPDKSDRCRPSTCGTNRRSKDDSHFSARTARDGRGLKGKNMAIEKLLDPALTPGGALHAQLHRFLASPFPFERRIVAERDAERFAEEGLRLLQTLEYSRLPDLLARLWTRHSELTHPAPRSGEQKPWSAAGEIERTIQRAQVWKYEPRIIDLVRQRLEDGEIITDWLPFEVVTSKNKWDRRSLRNECRFVTETNDAAFARTFLSADAIQEIIEAQERQQRQGEQPPWADNGNRDIPRVRE